MKNKLRALIEYVSFRIFSYARQHERKLAENHVANYIFAGRKCSYDVSMLTFFEDTKLIMGDYVHLIGRMILLRKKASVKIGSRSFVGSFISCASLVAIGDDVLIAEGGFITDHNSHALDFSLRANDVKDWLKGKKNWDNVVIKPVTIADKAWIGWGSIILKGVTIGEGAVVAAGSVVTKSVAPYTIVAGNPAKFVRNIATND